MEQPPVPSRKGARQGTPLGVAFFLVLGLAVLVIVGLLAALYYFRGEQRKTQEKLQALELQTQKGELERKTGAEKDRRLQAENSQQDLLRQARAATNALENLLAELKELDAGATALRTNDEGKRVALHPELIDQARAFYDVQLRGAPVAAEVITRLEAARRIEQQVLTQQGTAYEPTPDLLDRARQAAVSGEQDRGKVAQLRTALSTLVQESKIKYTEAKLTAGSPPLEEAIQAKVTAAAAAAQQTLVAQTTEAQKQAAQTLAEAEAKRIVEDANQKAAQMVAEAEEKKAALEREIALQQAEQKKADAQTQVAVETVQDEARKIELRKKAADPQVQAKLAPFLTPGYWQLNEITLDKKPLSFTKLKNTGALEPTTKGGSTLARIVSTSTDKVRPRWKINPLLYTRYPDAIERIKEAQQLLTELGPVLVEMGKLEP